MVRFSVAPGSRQGLRLEPFSAQLALARIHSRLAPLTRATAGYELDSSSAQGWFDLPPARGLAGYGLARALRILLDVLTGLSALHDTRTDAGLPFVHGELVPALIRVDGSGAARLMPLAPWHWSAKGKLPASERVGHLSPERLLGDAIDQRADVFSAGVLLWEALAGRRLFESDSSDQIIMRLMGGRVTLPALPPELSWALPLKDVAMCALSVDPEQRFANAADLAEAIEAVAAEQLATHAEVAAFFAARDPHARPSVIEPSLAVPTHNSSLSALVAPVALVAAAPSLLTTSTPRRSSAPTHRGSGRLWAAAAVLSLLVALGVEIAARGSGHAGASLSASPGVALKNQAPLATPRAAPSAAETANPTPPVTPLVASPAAEAPNALPAEIPTSHTKPLKASKGPKPSKPKLKAPLKAPPARDKDAEKYGI